MTTIHLTDAQRDTFAACGLIVIDGAWIGGGCSHEPPRRVAPEGGRRVVTLTATCPTCGGTGKGAPGHVCPHCLTAGILVGPTVVTLGRFTIPALLPVYIADVSPSSSYPGPGKCLVVAPSGVFIERPTETRNEYFTLDPEPRPGQFIARPERVA